jgi:hypothetical protein
VTSSRHLLQPDRGTQSGTLRKPDQYVQAEPVDLAVLDLRYPSLRDAEVFSRFGLRQPGLLQPLVDPGRSVARISTSAACSAVKRSWNVDFAIVIT